MKFISLDADDIIYQDGAANYVIDKANTAPATTTTGAGAEIPNGTTTYIRFYTGGLKFDAKDDSLVPDFRRRTGAALCPGAVELAAGAMHFTMFVSARRAA